MDSNKKIKLSAPDLLTVHGEAVKAALRKGIHEALIRHRQANNPVAIWRDGKVVLIPADEISIDEK